jgi:serine protease Do
LGITPFASRRSGPARLAPRRATASNPLDSAAATVPLMTHLLCARRRPFCAFGAHLMAALVLAASFLPLAHRVAAAHEVSPQRVTPVVLAVRNTRGSVVSIRGQKTVTASSESSDSADGARQVNGMGTGSIIDERGYILTNYHVVSDVRKIEVTLDDGRQYVAELVAYDAATDLAVIKIPAPKPLPVIRVGTSSDLMEGESVIALGNAFGYEQTVTRGIVSALNRDVQVSDTQSYDDLIQTDASINPGNSGGPLLNIDGEMVGVNVAVRANAQGIGFAIPIDNALKVATQLMSVQRLRGRWHGMVTQPVDQPRGPIRVAKVEATSPADKLGIQPGDEITRIGALAIARPLDVERALLDRSTGESVAVEVRRGAQTFVLDLALAESRITPLTGRPALDADAQKLWELFGVKLLEEPRSTFEQRKTRYRGGMRISEVRPSSPAAQEGILAGDILVGMHKWETASQQDIEYIVSRPNLSELGRMKFYVLRGESTLFGHIDVAKKSTASDASSSRR